MKRSLLMLLLPSVLSAQAAYRHAEGGLLPDSAHTPGSIVAVSTQTLCKPGYAKSVRHVAGSLKHAVYVAYGVKPAPGQHYEVDHLISLELGGSNGIENLWPQPYFGPLNAHDKDQLEDHLHSLVCKCKVSLAVAQKAISNDWIAAYHTYMK